MSQISLSEQPHLQQVSLIKLNLQQLTLLKQQLDQELTVFQDSLQTLKIAQTKFQESGSCLEKITPEIKEIRVIEKHFQGKSSINMLADYCWLLNKGNEKNHTNRRGSANIFYSKSILQTFFDFLFGKEILVPLTGSMYVNGQVGDTDSVLVDIGTGYFAEKSIEEAKKYFQNRVSYVSEQMLKIQQLGLEKSKIREATVDVMEMKLQGKLQDNAERT